jgi:hypothetical protein
MKKQHVTTVLTIVNLGILVFVFLHRMGSVQANSPANVLRGRKLEIVDAQGKVRASIQIQPEGPARMADGSVSKDGKIYPETVLFRLIRADGRPSVKISTSEQGSGLTLGGGIDPTYIVVSAQEGGSFVGTDQQGWTAAAHQTVSCEIPINGQAGPASPGVIQKGGPVSSLPGPAYG